MAEVINPGGLPDAPAAPPASRPATVSNIWFCKIGETDGDLPYGADLPMRQAIEAAYREITGEAPRFIFSGWGAELTEGERGVLSATPAES